MSSALRPNEERNVSISNEAGTTMIEFVLYVALFVVIAHSFVFFLLYVQHRSSVSVSNDALQYELFIAEVQRLLREEPFDDVSVVGTSMLRLQYEASQNDSYEIARYQNMLRMQRRGAGHVPLLLHVQDVEFVEERPYVIVRVEMREGERFETYLYVGERAMEK